MGFASSYLSKHSFYSPFVSPAPVRGNNLSVVIPCFNEAKVLASLNSLYEARRPSFPIEVIVVVNAPETATTIQIGQNKSTIDSIREWSISYNTDNFMVHVIDPPLFPRKHAGAGFARKTGMDEAVHRFNIQNNDKGIIVSFDADSLCDGNYFTELEKCFNESRRTGCSIYFEHPIYGDDHPAIVYNAIVLYELYLRYFTEAMRYSGFPHAFHTVGSCFAVNAGIYAGQGGMNRRTAGEDFYFLHKIIPLGNFTELNTTRVIPSPRVSDRVPFGTGATIRRFAEKLQSDIFTWPVQSFDDLKILFQIIPLFYQLKEEKIDGLIIKLPVCLADFLMSNDFAPAVNQMNKHSATPDTFKKRFFTWFNAFRLLKYLNYSRENCLGDQSVIIAASDLLQRIGISPAAGAEDLLKQFREIQRNKTWIC
jgi:glycosyltransferase involved in cell wall biosynthesis